MLRITDRANPSIQICSPQGMIMTQTLMPCLSRLKQLGLNFYPQKEGQRWERRAAMIVSMDDVLFKACILPLVKGNEGMSMYVCSCFHFRRELRAECTQFVEQCNFIGICFMRVES